jgi:hypothetical protein
MPWPRCPICGGLLRNERHLHAEAPSTVLGAAIRPIEIEVDDNTIETIQKSVVNYSEGGIDAEPPTAG